MQSLDYKKPSYYNNNYRMFKMIDGHLTMINGVLTVVAIIELIKLVLYCVELKGLV